MEGGRVYYSTMVLCYNPFPGSCTIFVTMFTYLRPHANNFIDVKESKSVVKEVGSCSDTAMYDWAVAICDETVSFNDKEDNLKSSKSPTPVCNKVTVEVESIVITDKIKAKDNHWIEIDGTYLYSIDWEILDDDSQWLNDNHIMCAQTSC